MNEDTEQDDTISSITCANGFTFYLNEDGTIKEPDLTWFNGKTEPAIEGESYSTWIFVYIDCGNTNLYDNTYRVWFDANGNVTKYIEDNEGMYTKDFNINNAYGEYAIQTEGLSSYKISGSFNMTSSFTIGDLPNGE